MIGGWQDPKKYYSGLYLRLKQAKQLLYPRRCPFCRRVLGFVLECPDCAAEREQLTRKTGMRLEPAQHYLGALDGAASPFVYGGCVRQAVLRAKYGGEAWTAVELGVWMARLLFGSTIKVRGGVAVPCRVEGAGLEYDCVLPVPPTSRVRGYNVPQLMALPVAYALGLPLECQSLRRIRASRRQAGLSLDERLVNVAGAFRAIAPERIEGKRILLLDDVITTGSTAAACAQALLDAGAHSVYAISLAAVEVGGAAAEDEPLGQNMDDEDGPEEDD